MRAISTLLLPTFELQFHLSKFLFLDFHFPRAHCLRCSSQQFRFRRNRFIPCLAAIVSFRFVLSAVLFSNITLPTIPLHASLSVVRLLSPMAWFRRSPWLSRARFWEARFRTLWVFKSHDSRNPLAWIVRNPPSTDSRNPEIRRRQISGFQKSAVDKFPDSRNLEKPCVFQIKTEFRIAPRYARFENCMYRRTAVSQVACKAVPPFLNLHVLGDGCFRNALHSEECFRSLVHVARRPRFFSPGGLDSPASQSLAHQVLPAWLQQMPVVDVSINLHPGQEDDPEWRACQFASIFSRS